MHVGSEVATWLVYQKVVVLRLEDGGARGIVRALDDDFKTAIAQKDLTNNEAMNGMLYAAVDPEPEQVDVDKKTGYGFCG